MVDHLIEENQRLNAKAERLARELVDLRNPESEAHAQLLLAAMARKAVVSVATYEAACARLAEVERERDELPQRLLDWRGVDVACERCDGSGRRSYGSTATWRGGIGGRAVTRDVCDECWGSGDAGRKGADLWKARAALDAALSRAEILETDLADVVADREAFERERDTAREALRVAREALEKHQRCYHGVPHCACTQPARAALAATKEQP